MTKEDIKKAATEYANEACRPLWRAGKEQVCMVDFIEGAKWRINSVWHDASEKPTEREMLVVIDKDEDMTQNDFMIDEFIGCDKWSDYVKDVGIIKWCYRKDLIPNKEE